VDCGTNSIQNVFDERGMMWDETSSEGRYALSAHERSELHLLPSVTHYVGLSRINSRSVNACRG
jgi:hypothetical protein